MEMRVVEPATANEAGGRSVNTDDAASASGFAVFDNDLRLVAWDDAYFEIQDLPSSFAERGRKYEDFVRYRCALQEMGIGETERKTASKISLLKGAQPQQSSWSRPDGEAITVWAIPIYGGGIINIAGLVSNGQGPRGFLSHSAVAASRHDVLDALDSMADGFAIFDRDDRMIFCNKAFRNIHDRFSRQLLPGLSYANFLKAGFQAEQFAENGYTSEHLYKFHKRARRGVSETFELELSDGRWLQCSEDGVSDGTTISIRSDITQIKTHAEELSRLTEKLKQQNLHFNTALNNMAQGLCLFDADQRLIVCNQRYRDMYGFSADVVKPGILLPEIMEYSVSLGNYASDEATSALSDRPIVASMKEQSVLEQHLRDGRVIAVLHSPMQGGGSVATYEDITERKLAERRLKEHADELEQRNAELQNFANVASHDLQEPLRKIEAFGGRLEKRFAQELGEDGQHYIARMQDASKRMRTLINELLTYSRLSSRDIEKEPCDLKRVVNEVLSDMEISVAEKRAKIEVGELPTVDASPTQMRQLFQNLLTNALKFNRPDVTPEVEISCRMFRREREDMPGVTRPFCEITVKDNGIGFEQKYADQIFGIFQRLHGRSTYEGTGIGLATCRKVVERHGGTIKAISAPDEGATFQIELPVKASQFGADAREAENA